jgi:hypothetical protein
VEGEKAEEARGYMSVIEALSDGRNAENEPFFAGIKDALLRILGLKRTLSLRSSPAPRSRCVTQEVKEL